MIGDDFAATPAERLAELVQSVQSLDLTAALALVLRAAVETVPADYADLSHYAGGAVTTIAAHGAAVDGADGLHAKTGQGPCTAVIDGQPIIRVNDLTRERRWPLFTATAAGLGIRALLSCRVTVRDRARGALTVYSTRPAVFDAHDETTGLLLATYAGIALTNAQTGEQLRTGLHSRDVVGQAKGLLMERYRITAPQAFALLVRISQDNNRRLIDLADRIIRTREDPTDAVRSLARRDQAGRTGQ